MGCESSAAQSFALAADNTVHIMGKCLDVTGSGTTNGTAVDLYTCNGTGAQTWTNGPNGSLVNPKSGLCLADPGSATIPGTDVILWTCDNGSEQNWNSGSSTPLPTAPAATSIINLPTGTYPNIASR
ncbi:RICIN domain-containing protein [Streptacidiphilus sp. 4-A2]|nr:RICIN domain-containing protein [Streptacidiphilus sp. 4-A2]